MHREIPEYLRQLTAQYVTTWKETWRGEIKNEAITIDDVIYVALYHAAEKHAASQTTGYDGQPFPQAILRKHGIEAARTLAQLYNTSPEAAEDRFHNIFKQAVAWREQQFKLRAEGKPHLLGYE